VPQIDTVLLLAAHLTNSSRSPSRNSAFLPKSGESARLGNGRTEPSVVEQDVSALYVCSFFKRSLKEVDRIMVQ
jgi:hypothetical protein